MAKKKQSFEESIKRLENIIEKMENSDTTLEDSLKLYKEGIELSSICSDTLNEIEKEVTLLSQNTKGEFSQKRFDNMEV